MYSDPTSSSSQSPDSLYSNASPMFADNNPFEFDEVLHEELDAGEYDALLSVEDIDQGEQIDRTASSSPAWGRWPTQSNLGGPGWTPLPTHGGLRSGSIISVSPRGSVSASRRGSAPTNKLSTETLRRNSAGHVLERTNRRRSSAKSQISPRRRSSVLSNGSTMDPAEDERLRRFARLDVLARRFSELVEVISPCPGDEEGMDDVARAREMISRWSPYSTETDVSEVRTMSMVPTPQLRPAAPALLSNFPLASVAIDYSLNTPDDGDSPIFPRFHTRLPLIESTPPPPAEPSDQLRRRTRLRPSVARALTDFTFPSRSMPTETTDEVDPTSRPVPRRATSTPQLVIPSLVAEASEPGPSAARDIPPKQFAPTGSFPLARSQPLGQSPLREKTRQASPKTAQAQEPRRLSIVAERRMSIVELGSSRSNTSRKPSRDVSPKSAGRNLSVEMDQQYLIPRRKSSTIGDLRRASSSSARRSSAASRKSSIVSLGEYGYLADEIDTPVPPLPTVTQTTPPRVSGDSLRSRRNAPPSITLPANNFPSSISAPSLISPHSATPRYNPLDTFFGRPTPGLLASSGQSPDSLTPDSDLSSPKTPGLYRSVLDRGRPVASPEFNDAFPLRSSYSAFTPSTATPKAEAGSKATDKPMKSPSYHFPVMLDNVARPPMATTSRRLDYIAPETAPLKSILIKRVPAPAMPKISVMNPVPHLETAPMSKTESRMERDIQALLRSRHESLYAGEPAQSGHSADKARPAILRHSSFPKLFQRAKAQRSPP